MQFGGLRPNTWVTEARPSLVLADARRLRRPPAGVRLAELAAVVAADIEASDLGRACRELVAAARLLAWKLRWLLRPWEPVPPADAPGPEPAVAPELAEAVRTVVAFLQARQEAGLESFGPAARPGAAGRFEVTVDELTAALEACLARARPEPVPLALPPRVPLVALLRRLELALRGQGSLRFSAFLRQLGSRDEVVAAFLALLVLAGRGRVRAYQAEPFGEIVVEAVGP